MNHASLKQNGRKQVLKVAEHKLTTSDKLKALCIQLEHSYTEIMPLNKWGSQSNSSCISLIPNWAKQNLIAKKHVNRKTIVTSL